MSASTMEARTRLVLDVSMTMCQATVSVMQNDTARKVIVSLVQDGRPFRIPPGAYVIFQARREIDGEEYPIFDACTVDHVRNAILYDIPENTTAVEGVFEGQFLIMDRDGSTLFCPKMTLVVRKNLFQTSVLESEGFSALQALVEQFRDESGAMDARMDALSDSLEKLKESMTEAPTDLGLAIGEDTGNIQLRSGGEVLSQVSLGGLELKLNGKILTLAMVTGAATILLGSCVLDGLSGGGGDCLWTETEREQLATVLEHNAYADTEAQETAAALIESLRSGGTQEPETEYITVSFSLSGAVAVIGGDTLVDGSAYMVEKGEDSIQVTVRPVSGDCSAWPSDGAVITVGGAAPSDGQEVTLDGLSCYQFTVVPSADMVVSCTLASLVPEEPWVPVELAVSCALPASGSATGSYLLYTGTGRQYGTVESLKGALTVTCRYERTGEYKTGTVELYTLTSSTFGAGSVTATEGTDTLTVSYGDLTAQVYLVLAAADECQGMSLSYNAASLHVEDNVSSMFDTIGLVVSMKYQGDVAVTAANWSDYVAIYSYSYLTAGDRLVESGQDTFAVIPAGASEPTSDATKYKDVMVNGCYAVTVELTGCTANQPGGLYLGGGTHVFVLTPNAGYELAAGDVVIGGAGSVTYNDDGTVTVTLEELAADISVVVNATVQETEITVSIEEGAIKTNATTATVSGGKIILMLS